MRRAGLYIDKAGKKGRGVYTEKAIPANTVIEIAPVIILNEKDRKQVEETKLFYYIFEWGDDAKQGIVALGYVSMYNHASPSNCEYEMDYKAETITIKTMRAIVPGEEITINYSAGWDDWQPVWFKEEKKKKKKK
ncbi:MAG: SET domain-containing protein-lysine N-methyltransferase [Bacteroidota bacterium]